MLHERCLLQHIRLYDDKFPCPSCRAQSTVDAVELNDEWNADDILERLLNEDEDFEDHESPVPPVARTTRRSVRARSTECRKRGRVSVRAARKNALFIQPSTPASRGDETQTARHHPSVRPFALTWRLRANGLMWRHTRYGTPFAQ